ncbi:hypothetical protein Hanom_Chr01g00007921 [Helianthus anomalus]
MGIVRLRRWVWMIWGEITWVGGEFEEEVLVDRFSVNRNREFFRERERENRERKKRRRGL